MMEQLCSQDRAILNSLFNPLLPLGEAVVDDVNVDQPQVDGEAAVAGDLSVTPEAKELNSQAVRATEDGRKDDALEAFERAIRISPNWAALYNNRAQLYRLMRKEQEAIKDLDKALELSKGTGTVGCQALVQRGLLHRLEGEEDRARDCFTRAADLGSTFAKTQLVALNPMAALCNKMLVRMVADAREGKVTE